LAITFDGDALTDLTDEYILGLGVRVCDGVEKFFLELNVCGVVAVLHLGAELNDQVPSDKLAMLTVEEVSASQTVLLLKTVDQSLVQGCLRGRGTVAPFGSLMRGQTSPSERRGPFLKDAFSPFSSEPSHGVFVWSFCSSCSACGISGENA
jgi:hypothetical protein